jgi:hypothetical protein
MVRVMVRNSYLVRIGVRVRVRVRYLSYLRHGRSLLNRERSSN